MRRFSIIPWQPSSEECFLNLEQEKWTVLLFSSVKHKRKQCVLFQKIFVWIQRATNIQPFTYRFLTRKFHISFPWISMNSLYRWNWWVYQISRKRIQWHPLKWKCFPTLIFGNGFVHRSLSFQESTELRIIAPATPKIVGQLSARKFPTALLPANAPMRPNTMITQVAIALFSLSIKRGKCNTIQTFTTLQKLALLQL